MHHFCSYVPPFSTLERCVALRIQNSGRKAPLPDQPLDGSLSLLWTPLAYLFEPAVCTYAWQQRVAFDFDFYARKRAQLFSPPSSMDTGPPLLDDAKFFAYLEKRHRENTVRFLRAERQFKAAMLQPLGGRTASSILAQQMIRQFVDMSGPQGTQSLTSTSYYCFNQHLNVYQC